MTNKMTYAQAVRRAIEGTVTPEVIPEEGRHFSQAYCQAD